MAEEHQENTEERIKNIARKIFEQKGYTGTTVRDIAEAADINIALLNYYFRSKEKLFQEIFLESFINMFKEEHLIFEEKDLSLFEKIQKSIDFKLNVASKSPDLPLFILGEMKQHIEQSFFSNASIQSFLIQNCFFEKQLKEAILKKEIRMVTCEEIKIMINSLVLFPFMSQSMIKNFDNFNKNSSFSYESFIKGHKERVYQMIYNYLIYF